MHKKKVEEKRVKEKPQRPAAGHAKGGIAKEVVEVEAKARRIFAGRDGRMWSPEGEECQLTFEDARSCHEGPLSVGKGCEMLQGQDTGWVLEKTPTVRGYLGSHGAEVFHLVTPHLVDDLFQSGKVGFLLFFGLSFPDGSHLNENLVICQG